MRELTVTRTILTSKCTLSELTVKGLVPIWYVLEDVDRDANRDGDLADEGEAKVAGETAIPAGTYSIKWQWSPSFKQVMPFLQNVPGFSGVMIHPGNTIGHTRGCLLVGKRPFRVDDETYEVHSSKQAFAEISALLKDKKGVYEDGVVHIVYAEGTKVNQMQDSRRNPES